jgi:hypothetical protein
MPSLTCSAADTSGQVLFFGGVYSGANGVKTVEAILAQWQHLDYYAHCYLGGGEVDVWDCTTSQFAWRHVGSSGFVYIDTEGKRVYGRFWEPQFLLFPKHLFTADEICVCLN